MGGWAGQQREVRSFEAEGNTALQHCCAFGVPVQVPILHLGTPSPSAAPCPAQRSAVQQAQHALHPPAQLLNVLEALEVQAQHRRQLLQPHALLRQAEGPGAEWAHLQLLRVF